MKTIAKIELSKTAEGKFFVVVNLPNDSKDYVGTDAKTARIALTQAATIVERHGKE